MFTLPVNRDSTVNLSVPGKQSKPRTWKLTTIVQAGITVDETGGWIPGDQTSHLANTTFTLDILLDGVVSSTHTVLSTQQILVDKFTDTDQTTTRTLSFRLTGKQEGPVVDEIHDLIKINFSIEDLKITNKIFELSTYRVFNTEQTQIGSQILGQNGELSIPLTTPIYTWLLANEKLISPK